RLPAGRLGEAVDAALAFAEAVAVGRVDAQRSERRGVFVAEREAFGRTGLRLEGDDLDVVGRRGAPARTGVGAARCGLTCIAQSSHALAVVFVGGLGRRRGGRAGGWLRALLLLVTLRPRSRCAPRAAGPRGAVGSQPAAGLLPPAAPIGPVLAVDHGLDPAHLAVGLARAGGVGSLLVHKREAPHLLQGGAPAPHDRHAPGVEDVHAARPRPGAAIGAGVPLAADRVQPVDHEDDAQALLRPVRQADAVAGALPGFEVEAAGAVG